MRKKWEHGTITGYTVYSCRCDLCKKAASDYWKSYKIRKNLYRKKRETWKHGTTSGYTKGCRCALCTSAITAYNLEYRKSHPKPAKAPNPIAHGTKSGYDRGCRCPECKRACRDYNVLHKWWRNRNLQSKLAHLIRCRLLGAIDKNARAGSAVRDLGCTIDELIKWIEFQFQEGMSWENHGFGDDKWNIDHIQPLGTFDLTNREQFLKAVHYTNLRPLWQKDNMRRPRDGSDAIDKSIFIV